MRSQPCGTYKPFTLYKKVLSVADVLFCHGSTRKEEFKWRSHMHESLPEPPRAQVYQTGDLANMDGLPKESKVLLPSLFAIRDGLYSLEFRRLVQSLTGSGPLSGEQIDLSVNAFGHTGHLLCHDDVIGTRKASIKVCHISQSLSRCRL